MVILVVISHLNGCTTRLYYPKPRVDMDNDKIRCVSYPLLIMIFATLLVYFHFNELLLVEELVTGSCLMAEENAYRSLLLTKHWFQSANHKQLPVHFHCPVMPVSNRLNFILYSLGVGSS